MTIRHWIFKSEPSSYSYQDLRRDGVAEWDGVRNFQARNFLRDDIKLGHRVLFYHSNTEPPAVIGTAIVSRSGYPDHTALDPEAHHSDPRSTVEKPIWYMVDIKAEEQFRTPVTLSEMRGNPNLENMMLLRKGMRLSVQPVTLEEFLTICTMGRKTYKTSESL